MFSILARACVVVVCVVQGQFSPITKLAVGYLLDELKNDITREAPAIPRCGTSIDYVVTNPAVAGRALPSRNFRKPTPRSPRR